MLGAVLEHGVPFDSEPLERRLVVDDVGVELERDARYARFAREMDDAAVILGVVSARNPARRKPESWLEDQGCAPSPRADAIAAR